MHTQTRFKIHTDAPELAQIFAESMCRPPKIDELSGALKNSQNQNIKEVYCFFVYLKKQLDFLLLIRNFTDERNSGISPSHR